MLVRGLRTCMSKAQAGDVPLHKACTGHPHAVARSQTCAQVKDIFGRAAQQAKQLGTFLPSLLLFLRTRLGPWLAGLEEAQAAVGKVGQNDILARLLAAEQVRAAACARMCDASMFVCVCVRAHARMHMCVHKCLCG